MSKRHIPILDIKTDQVLSDEDLKEKYPQQATPDYLKTQKGETLMEAFNVRYVCCVDISPNKVRTPDSVVFRCLTCGYYFPLRLWNFLNNHSKKGANFSFCPYCSFMARYKRLYKQKLQVMNQECIGVYDTDGKLFKLKCNSCGHTWRVRTVRELGARCPKCLSQKTPNSVLRHEEDKIERPLTKSQVAVRVKPSTQVLPKTFLQIKAAFKLNDIDATVNASTYSMLSMHCLRCNHRWEAAKRFYQNATSFTCPNCHSRIATAPKHESAPVKPNEDKVKTELEPAKAKTDPIQDKVKVVKKEVKQPEKKPQYSPEVQQAIKDFRRKIRKTYGWRYDINGYDSTRNMYKVLCWNCSKEWLTTPEELFSGKLCPRCSHNFVN